MLSLNQAKPGAKIIWRSAPHEIVEANHLKVGRGGAKLVTKLRNLLTGAVIDFTFAGDERLEVAEVRYRAAQFLYHEGDLSYFMTNDDFETLEVKLPKSQAAFLVEGAPADLMIWQDQAIAAGKLLSDPSWVAIGVNLPKKVTLKVAYTEPGFKGNSQSATLKPAKLETDLEIQVPLFISTGDAVVVNTETGKYDARG